MGNESQPRTPEEVFVERVRILRRTRGWTLEEMAHRFEAAGYGAKSRQAMTMLEAGEVKRLTLAQVHAAAVAFDVPPLALLTTEDPSQQVEVATGVEVDLGRFTEWWRAERALGDDPWSKAWLLLNTPRWLYDHAFDSKAEREMTGHRMTELEAKVSNLETENLALLKIVADQAAALARRER